MHKKTRLRPCALLALAVVAAALLSGCGLLGKGSDRAGIQFTKGNMLHLQQVLERYDAAGNPVPQYLELWLTADQGRGSELNEDGQEIAVALDTGKKHLYWDAATLQAEEGKESRLFVVTLAAMKKAYPKVKATNDGTYAGRDCTFYLMDTGNAEEWAKLYVDKQTGYVLLCDAETFRLRTKLIEDVPVDKSLFSAPEGLKMKGGDGK